MGERILLVGEDDRIALAAARSLARAGFHVVLGMHDRRSVCLASRAVREHVVLPDAMREPGEFARAVVAAGRERRPALVLPVGDPAIAALMDVRGEIEGEARLAVPSTEAWSALFDRRRTHALALAGGVPVPATTVVETFPEAAAVPLALPLVLRPATPLVWGAAGGVRRVERRAADRDAYLRKIEEMLPNGPVLVQEEVAGDAVGVALLLDQGQVVAAFQERRLDPRPTHRVSEPLDQGLLELAVRLIQPLAYTGVAAVTFRRGKGGIVLDEADGRPGGWLPLAVAAGIDFPRLWVELLLSVALSSRALGEYRVNLHSRSLVLEVEHLSDPGPVLAELRALARRAAGAGVRLGERFVARAARLVTSPPRRAASHILVLCDGNLCRSPFAEARLKARLADRCVTVESAGLRAALGHPAPPLARAAALRHGVNLDAHGSRPLERPMVECADLILVMDLDQRRRLLAQFPAAAGRVELLGRYDPARLASPEIPDPMFGDAGLFARVYGRIERAAGRLAGSLVLRPAVNSISGPGLAGASRR
jgi:protein-tyrosine-phosphatase/predicted ATP-grasp superfamily ATP-dependent carboligase